jgi:AcrR family transcriptional regulator
MATRKTYQFGPVRVRVTQPDAEGPRERLTRDQIVSVALAQMAEHGYDAVSMRSIARELGTGPASLYAHVANKDALDLLVIDRISSMVRIPAPEPARWREQLVDVLHATLAAYRAHPGSARAALAMIPINEGGLMVTEGLMAILLAGGITPRAAAWFVDLGALYVSAIAAEESIWIDRHKAAVASGRTVSEAEVVEEIRDLFAGLPAATYPILSSHAEVMTSGDGDERFRFGLEVLLAGLEVVSERMAEQGR